MVIVSFCPEKVELWDPFHSWPNFMAYLMVVSGDPNHLLSPDDPTQVSNYGATLDQHGFLKSVFSVTLVTGTHIPPNTPWDGYGIFTYLP